MVPTVIEQSRNPWNFHTEDCGLNDFVFEG